MTDVHWKHAVDGKFAKAGNWKGDAVPGPADAAILDAAGSAFTVTSDRSAAVASIQLAANVTLDIANGAFTASDGTGAGANAGLIEVADGATFKVGGAITNTGVITLESAGADTHLLVGADTTLSGGGVVALSDNFSNRIFIAGGSVLTNVDDTIAGSGIISNQKAGLAFVNETAGTIDSTGLMTIEPYRARSGSLVNSGLIEATNGGTLFIGMTISGSGGRIMAGDGSMVDILGLDTITGQELDIGVNAGLVVGFSTVTTTSPISNLGDLVVETSGREVGILNESSSLDNAGLLQVDGGTLTVGGAVEGGGQVFIYNEGLADFGASFDQAVTFGYYGKARGRLELAQSQSFTNSITGFAKTGLTSLDLRDVGFVSAGEASFAHGVLTVSDGTHAAHINLIGDYGSAVFTAASDGQGGVLITATAPSPARFAQAAAAIPDAAALCPFAREITDLQPPSLTAPRH